jgi:hypothetical protein
MGWSSLRWAGTTPNYITLWWVSGQRVNVLNVPIAHLLVNRKDWIRYEYDFGDGWIHRLTLEDIHVQPLKLARLPRCLAGKRACPPEDSGGVPGYE